MEAEHGAGVGRGRRRASMGTLIDRPRLFAFLTAAPALTVVRGPRGAGKTSLLATWTATLDAAPGRILAMPAPTPSISPDAYWARVHAEVADAVRVYESRRSGADGTAPPVIVTFDDVDRLKDPATETRVLDLLDRHDCLRAVVTTRTTDVFGDDRLFDVDHTTITPGELLFTFDESAAALRACGVELPRHLLKTTQEVSGGLPPLVRASVAVARPLGVDTEGGDDGSPARRILERAIDRYVEREILGDPELSDLRDFMLALAAARVATAGVAEALTGDRAAAEILPRLESAGILVRTPWPDDHEWRYPTAIRESFRRKAHLEATSGPLPAASRLARWYAAQGEIAAALEHAVDAQDWDLAITLVKTKWVDLLSRHVRLIRETLMTIPAEAAVRDPVIRAGRELFVRLGSVAAERPSPTPAPTIEPSPDPARTVVDTLSVGSVQSMILRAGGNFAQASALAARMSELGERAPGSEHEQMADFLPLLRLQWGIAHQLHGDLDRSSTEFRRSYHDNRPAGPDFVSCHAAGSLALNYALTGELRHAESWFERGRRYDDESTWIARVVRVSALVASALVAIDRMEVEAAAKTVAELDDLPDDAELWAFAAYAHCQLALVTRQADVGLDHLHRASAVYARWHTRGSFAAPLLAAAEADLHLALGHGNEAWMTLAAISERSPWLTISHARMGLVSGQPSETLADCLRPEIADCPFPRVRMEAALLQAAAYADLGHQTPARNMLRRAVALFEQTGIIRPFASMPARAVTPLSTLGVELPPDWTAAAPPEGAAVYPDHVQLVDLSQRESAVLAALVATPSIAEIASRLFVSQNTVKSQLRSLYRKLGVHRRADALLTASRLGLID